jgi:hypothetical protein
MTYVTHIEDDNGDLVDILIYCSETCATDFLRKTIYSDFFDSPCHEPSSHAYCANCGESVKHGANCFSSGLNELTAECPEYDESDNTCEARNYVCCEQEGRKRTMSNTPAYDYTETDTDIVTDTERAIAMRAWKAGYNARYHEETDGARDETDWTIAERGETDNGAPKVHRSLDQDTQDKGNEILAQWAEQDANDADAELNDNNDYDDNTLNFPHMPPIRGVGPDIVEIPPE